MENKCPFKSTESTTASDPQWNPNGAYLNLAFAPPLKGSDIPYDPTNGTVSFGNILYTQKQNFSDVK